MNWKLIDSLRKIVMRLTDNQVLKSIKEWRSILNLDLKWKIKHLIRKDPVEMSQNNEDSQACILISGGYYLATMEINEKLIEDSQEFNEVILHELLHLIIYQLAQSSTCGLGEQYSDMASDLIESTIEKLTPGYITLYNKAFPKKIRKHY